MDAPKLKRRWDIVSGPSTSELRQDVSPLTFVAFNLDRHERETLQVERREAIARDYGLTWLILGSIQVRDVTVPLVILFRPKHPYDQGIIEEE